MKQQKIILIAGPTASGKSALALELAGKTRGSVINADAMQVYEGLPLLTNQPSEAERQAIPHRLYGVLDPSEGSSAGKWLALARTAICETIAEGRTPILVGGTGLYFRALVGGLADIPNVPDDVRAKAQKLYDEIGEEKFRRELSKLDAESAAKLAKNDRQRLVRAYEVAVHTGKPLSYWQKKTSSRPNNAAFDAHLLMPTREKLYAACDARFLKMIESSAVEEVRAFLKRNLDPALSAMKTIGVREIGTYLGGKITLDEAISKAQQATRNYAKRQMTWFRNQWGKLGNSSP